MKQKLFTPFVSIVLALSVSPLLADHHGKDGWTDLCDGKTLKGWTQRNGTATYRVEDGAIVGKTKQGSPNSFLCTDRRSGGRNPCRHICFNWSRFGSIRR